MPKRNVSPVRLELLITIVDKRKAEFYADLLQSFDVNFQFTTAAAGTASDSILEYLGLSGNEKAAIFSVLRADRMDAAAEALEEKFRTIKGGEGIAVAVPFSSVISLTAFDFLSGESTSSPLHTLGGTQ